MLDITNPRLRPLAWLAVIAFLVAAILRLRSAEGQELGQFVTMLATGIGLGTLVTSLTLRPVKKLRVE